MEMSKLYVPLLTLMVVYSMMKTHVMNNLITIEFMVVTVIVGLFMVIKVMNFENHLVLYFIVLMITESIVGLSMMISMIRTHGNDFLKSSSIVKF
uniref:NADH-ubiquinone oxidoreductase chain 4L n=1 Tax=Bemisia afer TaxID=166114 RepID=A0A023IZ99_BEMAF|nr:NADH dehydrogenase subunit 4L [Bemisia afer]AHC02244.1 NADH dehydrogenase subunit 4L [Bemisia afer]